MNGQSPRLFILGWIAVILLFVLAGLMFRHGMNRVVQVVEPETSGTLVVGKALPDAPLWRLDGSRTTLRAYVGHPVWINFFATWCVPCKAEIPEIERRYGIDKPAGLVVLGVDQQESAAAVASFARHFNVSYPIAIDGGDAAAQFDLRTIPLSVFVDAAGTIRSIRIGQMQPDAMDAALLTILPGG
jgi:cytochrome c biogenesis protein CcmG, thiol:disulfide interchange protein DsbE